MSSADQASIAEALRRVEVLETLLLHLITNGLQHPHCRACQDGLLAVVDDLYQHRRGAG